MFAYPQRFYDPTLSDYNPIIYKYYKYLAKADPILRSGDFIIEQIDIPREQGVEELHLIFAYHCGLWNGIVDQFEGIAMTGSLLSQGVELIFNLELQKQFNSAYQSWKVNCETNNSSLTYAGCAWDMIWDGIKKAHTEGSTPQIAQQYGKTTIDIASIAIAFTKAGKLANVNKFMDAIDPLNQVMKYTGKGVGVAFKLGDKAVKGAFVYSLEKLQFFSKYKLSIKFNNSNLYSGIPIPDVNVVKKADLEKKLNALTEAELDKLPRDENGIRLVEIDGEVIPIGPEGKIDELIGKVYNSTKELFEDISKNRSKIREVLNTDAGKAYAKKYFDKFEKGNFEKWYENTFKKYDLGEPLNFEVHHVIPVKVLEKNKELQELLLWAKKNGKDFDFNSIDNGIPLQKKSIKFEQSGHANHPKYDNAITEKINDILEKAPSEEKAFERIQNLISDTKGKLEADVLLGTKDVNQIVNF